MGVKKNIKTELVGAQQMIYLIRKELKKKKIDYNTIYDHASELQKNADFIKYCVVDKS